ncbi:hypothetical protein EG329_014062 [Mollisiaceae sp. DMI_Dod_QoI]|nr:hypothetical protein EG329_014062 [Helotiales sp. DMI_Dod_QoI]
MATTTWDGMNALKWPPPPFKPFSPFRPADSDSIKQKSIRPLAKNNRDHLFYLSIAADLPNYVKEEIKRRRHYHDARQNGDILEKTSIMQTALQIAATGPRISSSKESRARMIEILLTMDGVIDEVVHYAWLVVTLGVSSFDPMEEDRRLFDLGDQDRLSIARVLLGHGADPNHPVHPDGEDWLTLPEVFTLGTISLEMLQLLRRYGATLPESVLFGPAMLWRKFRDERRSGILKELVSMADEIETSIPIVYDTSEDYAVLRRCLSVATGVLLSTGASLIGSV